MAVDEVTETRIDLLRYYDKVSTRRWQYAGVHMAFHAYISVGWLPDGRWWTTDGRQTSPHLAWVYTGLPSAARAAAERRAATQMAVVHEPGGCWERTTAMYGPRGDAAMVREWPPGFEPR